MTHDGPRSPHLLWVGLASLTLLGAGPVPRETSLADRLREGLRRFVDEKQVAGAVALVGRPDKVLAVEAVGRRDIESGAAMEPDTVFRVMSMTKPVTAVAVIILADEKKLALDDPVADHLPEFLGQKLLAGVSGETVRLAASPRPITIRDLLTHTSGLPDVPPPGYTDLDDHADFTLAEAVKVIAGRPLSFPPGSRWAYSNAGMTTLGRVVEVVSGKPYEDFLKERLFDPLGMVDTTFYPTPSQRSRAAVVYEPTRDGLKAVASSRAFPERGTSRPSPAGGLFSTAPDMAKFHRMMILRGLAAERRYLAEPTVAAMTRVQTGDLKTGFVPGMGYGLGWGVVRSPEGVNAPLDRGSFGHGGYYGTQGWVDPTRKRYAILMIQRVGLKNPDDTPIRAELQRIAFDEGP